MNDINQLRITLVTAKALAYAIKTIEALPKRWQEWSDKEDMKMILHDVFPMWEDIAKQSAEHHIDGAAAEEAATSEDA
jgi:hypothetical protein